MHNMKKRHMTRGTRTSLRDQVARVLRDEILSGGLKPGSVLNEKVLAERLGVSKTPVREALTLLDHEGLIQTLPRKGYFVSPVTIQDISDAFGLRMILESAAAEMAATKITNEEIEELSRLSSEFDSTENPTEQLDLNLRFHDYIGRLSGNDRLASLIRQLHLEMKRMIAVGWKVPGHAKLVSAFREHDARRAGEVMRDQILAVRDRASRLIAGGSPEPRPDQVVSKRSGGRNHRSGRR